MPFAKELFVPATITPYPQMPASKYFLVEAVGRSFGNGVDTRFLSARMIRQEGFLLGGASRLFDGIDVLPAASLISRVRGR